MVSAPCALRTVITSAIKADIGASLQADEAVMSSTPFREQCFRACRILRDQHSVLVLFELIGDLFEVDQGTIWNHWKKYTSRCNQLKLSGRPPALSPSQVDDILETIALSWHGGRYHFRRSRQLFQQNSGNRCSTMQFIICQP
jgi:hypothetical protein